MTSKPVYTEVDASQVPESVRDGRWDVPGHCQGQIVEVAYSADGGRAESGPGARYRRTTDRSDRSVTYARLVTRVA